MADLQPKLELDPESLVKTTGKEVGDFLSKSNEMIGILGNVTADAITQAEEERNLHTENFEAAANQTKAGLDRAALETDEIFSNLEKIEATPDFLANIYDFFGDNSYSREAQQNRLQQVRNRISLSSAKLESLDTIRKVSDANYNQKLGQMQAGVQLRAAQAQEVRGLLDISLRANAERRTQRAARIEQMPLDEMRLALQNDTAPEGLSLGELEQEVTRRDANKASLRNLQIANKANDIKLQEEATKSWLATAPSSKLKELSGKAGQDPAGKVAITHDGVKIEVTNWEISRAMRARSELIATNQQADFDDAVRSGELGTIASTATSTAKNAQKYLSEDGLKVNPVIANNARLISSVAEAASQNPNFSPSEDTMKKVREKAKEIDEEIKKIVETYPEGEQTYIRELITQDGIASQTSTARYLETNLLHAPERDYGDNYHAGINALQQNYVNSVTSQGVLNTQELMNARTSGGVSIPLRKMEDKHLLAGALQEQIKLTNMENPQTHKAYILGKNVQGFHLAALVNLANRDSRFKNFLLSPEVDAQGNVVSAAGFSPNVAPNGTLDYKRLARELKKTDLLAAEQGQASNLADTYLSKITDQQFIAGHSSKLVAAIDKDLQAKAYLNLVSGGNPLPGIMAHAHQFPGLYEQGMAEFQDQKDRAQVLEMATESMVQGGVRNPENRVPGAGRRDPAETLRRLQDVENPVNVGTVQPGNALQSGANLLAPGNLLNSMKAMFGGD